MEIRVEAKSWDEALDRVARSLGYRPEWNREGDRSIVFEANPGDVEKLRMTPGIEVSERGEAPIVVVIPTGFTALSGVPCWVLTEAVVRVHQTAAQELGKTLRRTSLGWYQVLCWGVHENALTPEDLGLLQGRGFRARQATPEERERVMLE